MRDDNMKLSLVAPCYNEAENVAAFQDAVIAAFDGCGYDYEIVFVDDGSKDATLHNLKKLHAAKKCPTKVISFARNFGSRKLEQCPYIVSDVSGKRTAEEWGELMADTADKIDALYRQMEIEKWYAFLKKLRK